MSRYIKTRKIHSKENIIDVRYEEENNSYYYQETNKNNLTFDTIKMPVVIALVSILSLISGCLGAYLIITTTSPTIVTNDGVATSTAKLIETNSIATAVEKVYDAVVVVEVYKNEEMISTGTGFVYKTTDNQAYLMTNNHVVSGGESIKVLFTDETELVASLVGSDVYSDIAVLSVENKEKIVSATMGDSKKLNVGDTLFTVGSPEGSNYAGTVTKGVLSAKDRLVEVALSNNSSSDYYMQVLQTDAAINPGNSGGPICNINGEVIGITNMKLVDDTVEGMGFAIPIEDALKVANILEKEGKVTRPYIGISMLDISNSYYLWQAGIMLPENIESGVAIYKVESGSPAERAGLKKGDIITKLASKTVKSLADFRYELYKHEPNEEVEVTYFRNGKQETTKLTLGKGE